MRACDGPFHSKRPYELLTTLLAGAKRPYELPTTSPGLPSDWGAPHGHKHSQGQTEHQTMRPPRSAAVALYLVSIVLGIEAECNKNKHCEAGSFCACNTECTDKDGACQTCESMGQPSFEPGTVACERYERGCGLTCDGSNYEASQACPGDRVWLDCGTACEKVCGEKSGDVCTEQCVSACQCPKYTVLESADGDVCLRMKECRKRRKDNDDDMTFWGFDDDVEDWYADDAKKRKKKADDDDERSSAASSSSSSNTSDGPLADGASMTLGCVLVAGILIGAAAMRLRQAKRRPPPTVELGQVIVAEEVLKDLEPRHLDEPSPEVHSVDASTPTARPV